MYVVKAQCIAGEDIDVRAGIAMVAITAKVIGSERIDIDVENAHV